MDWNAAIEDNNNISLIDLKSVLTSTTRDRSRSTQKNKPARRTNIAHEFKFKIICFLLISFTSTTN